MGQFRFFAVFSFALLHVAALITLLILFNITGLDENRGYFWTSIGAGVFAILLSFGLVALQARERQVEQRSFPILLPFASVISLYDMVVLLLIATGWLMSDSVYLSFHVIAALFLILTLVVMSGFSDFVSKRDMEVKAATGQLKMLELKVRELEAQLMNIRKNEFRPLNDQIKSLLEVIRFSDPMSHQSVHSLELSIEEKLNRVQEQVETAAGTEESDRAAVRLSELLEEIQQDVRMRNERLRLLK